MCVEHSRGSAFPCLTVSNNNIIINNACDGGTGEARGPAACSGGKLGRLLGMGDLFPAHSDLMW